VRERRPRSQPDPGQIVRQFFAPSPPARLGVAVSGGSDSTALLHLLAEWRAEGGPDLVAATVDHGLRAEAREEAEDVARACATLSVPHDVLGWGRWDGTGNLSDAARRARYGLLAEWAARNGLGAIALGHTADDQAETFLMRLARGSGVDGLSGMAEWREAYGMTWVRPLLSLRRAALRDWLAARGICWADDPTNDDPANERVRARRALRVLDDLSLTVGTLTETAARLSMARDVLDAAALTLARGAVTIEAGDVVIARAPFEAAGEETQLRLFAHALRWITRAPYRPRFSALRDVMARALDGRRATLGGTLILPRAKTIRLTREPAATGPAVPLMAPWDGRWRVKGPAAADLVVRALGEDGLALCDAWRATGLPRPTVLASPSVWRGGQLVAAPLAGRPNGYEANLACGDEEFFTSLIAH